MPVNRTSRGGVINAPAPRNDATKPLENATSPYLVDAGGNPYLERPGSYVDPERADAGPTDHGAELMPDGRKLRDVYAGPLDDVRAARRRAAETAAQWIKDPAAREREIWRHIASAEFRASPEWNAARSAWFKKQRGGE